MIVSEGDSGDENPASPKGGRAIAPSASETKGRSSGSSDSTVRRILATRLGFVCSDAVVLMHAVAMGRLTARRAHRDGQSPAAQSFVNAHSRVESEWTTEPSHRFGAGAAASQRSARRRRKTTITIHRRVTTTRSIVVSLVFFIIKLKRESVWFSYQLSSPVAFVPRQGSIITLLTISISFFPCRDPFWQGRADRKRISGQLTQATNER